MTNVYRATRDLFLTQWFARHLSPTPTTVYTHPGVEEMRDRLCGRGCRFRGILADYIVLLAAMDQLGRLSVAGIHPDSL